MAELHSLRCDETAVNSEETPKHFDQTPFHTDCSRSSTGRGQL